LLPTYQKITWKNKKFRVIVLPMEHGMHPFLYAKIPLSIEDFVFSTRKSVICLIHVIVIHCT
jgi:hypothetical protein